MKNTPKNVEVPLSQFHFLFFTDNLMLEIKKLMPATNKKKIANQYIPKRNRKKPSIIRNIGVPFFFIALLALNSSDIPPAL